MIKLKDLLPEGKFKFKGKYLYMPTGEVSSIPGERDRDAIIFTHPRFGELKIWQQKGKIYMLGDDFDKYVKTNELEKYLNKNKYKYLGIDSRYG